MKYIEVYDEWIANAQKTKPYFPNDIWPYILKNKDKIDKVWLFLIKHLLPRPKKIAKEFKNASEIHRKIFFIGSFINMDDRECAKLEALSFYKGHLSVIYRTSDINFLTELIMKWNTNPVLTELKPGMKEDEYIIFNDFINDLLKENNGFLFGFGHDGEPLFIFDMENKLKILINNVNKRKL